MVRAEEKGSVDFEWSAPEGCPPASSVQAEIDELLGGAARDRAREHLSVRATVEHGSLWLVTLETQSGTASGHRTIEAVTCQGRADQGADADRLNAEVSVLKRAREELRRGRPARALEALAEYDRRFGRGVLVEERQAMAAIAACQVEPGPAARAQAEAFMRGAPASPLRARVREACITPARANSP